MREFKGFEKGIDLGLTTEHLASVKDQIIRLL